MKTALSPGELIPNPYSKSGLCVRSIDWCKKSVTLEVLYGDGDQLAFHYASCSFEEFYDSGLDLDREYCSEVLSRMLEYADPRNNLGRVKVPKATFNRIQRQKSSI